MLPLVVGHLLRSDGPVDCFHDGARLEQHGKVKQGLYSAPVNLVHHVGCYQWGKGEERRGS
ncbi:hypothetical protein SLEP1_g3605 [Rubroshorea leprosula]|uniref:Uncharacterized protein n=1 Tax=Rubroshorea leprosula TaxID=152421 RepID=A0AAV5HUP5_9ROSI|nr:hypothetical protein SLEP1_g3605 [Rubroshorea leprosula]